MQKCKLHQWIRGRQQEVVWTVSVAPRSPVEIRATRSIPDRIISSAEHLARGQDGFRHVVIGVVLIGRTLTQAIDFCDNAPNRVSLVLATYLRNRLERASRPAASYSLLPPDVFPLVPPVG